MSTESTVADLVSETGRLIASANHLVGAIEKNVASVERLVTQPLVLY